MTSELKMSLITSIDAAAQKAGLVIVSAAQSTATDGSFTAAFQLALSGDSSKTLKFELSDKFDFDKLHRITEIAAYLEEEAKRLRNPRPECAVTLAGLPLAFGQFQWPFHRSTSGADTYIVHGEIRLEGGATLDLRARIAASVSLTFAEIVPAMEQPYAESFIYNAIRKTVDMGQLEFLKAGNRQPVPVTTRYYSRWQKKFVFTETDGQERISYLLSKAYWLSGVLGDSKPVWIADPRDALYLNTTTADLLSAARQAASEGLIQLDGEYAAATPALLAQEAKYQAIRDAALAFTKPQFNEAMRAGQANM